MDADIPRHGYLGVAEWLRGRLAEAERALSLSIAQGRAAGQPIMTAWGYQDLGQVQRAQGRLDAAAGTYQQALEVAAAPSRTALPAAGIAYVGLAEVAYQRNELDTALRHVSEGIALCRQINFTQPLATGLATLAWIRQAQGDAAGAREAMEEAGRAAPGPGVAGLLNPVPAQRARLLLAQGDVAAAARWTQESGLGADDEPRLPAGARSTWCWPGCCSPRTAPARHSALLDRLPRRPSPGPHRQRHRDPGAAGARICSRRRGSRRGGQPWPRCSPWPARRATCGSSPTKDRRWPRCWAG